MEASCLVNLSKAVSAVASFLVPGPKSFLAAVGRQKCLVKLLLVHRPEFNHEAEWQ